jgi:tetratricopeptide (TPR) repeat protein
LYLAEGAHACGQHQKAIRLFSLLIADSNTHNPPPIELWTFYLHRGLSLRATDLYEQALEDYERSAYLNQRSHKPHLNAGIVLGQDLGRHREALAEFEKAVNLNPQDVESLMSVALARYELGAKDEAETILRQALKTDPTNVLMLYNLGNMCLNANRLPEAVDMFLRANQVDPHDSDVAQKLAVARSRLPNSSLPQTLQQS